eukprot:12442-Amphidinium_carterae.1
MEGRSLALILVVAQHNTLSVSATYWVAFCRRYRRTKRLPRLQLLDVAAIYGYSEAATHDKVAAVTLVTLGKDDLQEWRSNSRKPVA